MAQISRQELKSDEFLSGVDAAFEFYLQHQKTLLVGLAVVILVAAGIYGLYAWNSNRNEKAASELAAALDTFHAPLANAGRPVPAGQPSFANAAARATAAHKQFQQVVDSYASTRSGKFARFYLGLTELDMNQDAAAEKDLQLAASTGSDDVAPLAENALANLKIAQGKTNEAKRLLQSLATKNSSVLPSAVVLTELADLEATTQPSEAAGLYRRLQRDYPDTQTAEHAQQALAQLGQQ